MRKDRQRRLGSRRIRSKGIKFKGEGAHYRPETKSYCLRTRPSSITHVTLLCGSAKHTVPKARHTIAYSCVPSNTHSYTHSLIIAYPRTVTRTIPLRIRSNDQSRGRQRPNHTRTHLQSSTAEPPCHHTSPPRTQSGTSHTRVARSHVPVRMRMCTDHLACDGPISARTGGSATRLSLWRRRGLCG